MPRRGRPQTRVTIIGSLLDEQMQEHNDTQITLSKKINCSRKVISHAINHNEISLIYLERIAKNYHIHTDYFIGKVKKKKPSEGSAGNVLIVNGEKHGRVLPDGDLEYDADSYDEFIDIDDREGWAKRFADMENHGYALPSFQPLLIQQKKDALPYLRSLLSTRYLSAEWEDYLFDDAVMFQLLDSIKESGSQLLQEKKEGK